MLSLTQRRLDAGCSSHPLCRTRASFCSGSCCSTRGARTTGARRAESRSSVRPAHFSGYDPPLSLAGERGPGQVWARARVDRLRRTPLSRCPDQLTHPHLAGAKTARPTGGCLPKTPGKTRYTRESPGLPEKYLDARPHAAARHTPRAPVPTAARTACSSTRTAPCVLATSAKTQKAASAPGTACRRRCGRRGRANILLQDRGGAPHALVRPRSTDRKEAAQQADCCRHTICYLTRGEFGEDEHDSRVSPTHAGWSSKSCTRTAERTNV